MWEKKNFEFIIFLIIHTKRGSRAPQGRELLNEVHDMIVRIRKIHND